MTIEDTSVEDTATLDYDVDTEEDRLDEPEEFPRRRRRKLLAPVPVALLAALLLAGGFLAGVEVEKGQAKSTASAGDSAGFAALRGGAGSSANAGGGRASSGSFPGGGAGFPGGAGFAGNLTRGEVSYVSGNTLYVTSGEGSTVKVNARTGTRVSKTVSASLHSIHPGDTVTVAGSQGKNGSVTASSISLGARGSSVPTSSSRGSSGAGEAPQLFGSG
jgi:hypothetical protein